MVGEIFKYTYLKWINMHSNCAPYLEKKLKFTDLKRLEMCIKIFHSFMMQSDYVDKSLYRIDNAGQYIENIQKSRTMQDNAGQNLKKRNNAGHCDHNENVIQMFPVGIVET